MGNIKNNCRVVNNPVRSKKTNEIQFANCPYCKVPMIYKKNDKSKCVVCGQLVSWEV